MFSRFRRPMPLHPPLRGRFLNILMDATSACNLTCRMCPQSLPLATASSRKPDVLSETALRRIVEEILPFAAAINLSCIAEPFANPKFTLFLEMMEGKAPPATGLVTNGMNLTDDMIERLIRAGVATVAFSLDSPDKETFEWIRRGGDFDRIIDSIRRLGAHKKRNGLQQPGIQINCVLMKRNIRDLTRLIELAAEIGAGEVDLRHLLRIEGLDKELAEETLYYDQTLADDCLAEAAQKAKELGIHLPAIPYFQPERRQPSVGLVTRWKAKLRNRARTFVRAHLRLPRCDQPWNNLNIHPNGDLFPCCNWIYEPSTKGAQVFSPPRGGHSCSAERFRVGNIETQSFEEIWNGETYRALREELTGKGPLRDLCRHCPVRLGLEEDLYDPKRDSVDMVRDLTQSKS